MRRPLAVALIAGCAVAGGIAGAASSGRTALDGLLFDLAVAARAAVLAEPPPLEAAPVAVVAVDARSLASPELSPYPRALFGPVWGELIESLGQAGAKAIAFDFLLSYSANALQPGHDRGMLAALSRWRERIVLGRSAGALPAQPYLAALRLDPAALALLEMEADPDGAVRRLHATRAGDDAERLPTLAAAALARAGGPAMPAEALLAPPTHPERLPTYALIDVLRCAGAPDALREAFAGRVVFIGTTLPEEDRKLSSARFLRPQPATEPPASGCALAPLGASVPGSRSVPGVHLHAVAADSVLRGAAPQRAPSWAPAIVAAAGAGAGAAAGAGVETAPSSPAITAITVPTFTLSVPSGTVILPITPSSTASNSIVALSVSISASKSPDLTVSPSLTSHLASVPSSIVGDSAGILISIDMEVPAVEPGPPLRRCGVWSSRNGIARKPKARHLAAREKQPCAPIWW